MSAANQPLALGREPRRVAAQHLDEQQFHQAAEHQLGARRGGVGEREDLPHRGGDERADLVVAGAVDQQGRQRAKHRREQELRRFEEAAHHAGLLAAAAVVDGPHPLDRAGTHEVRAERHLHEFAVPELVRIGERQQQDVAGRHGPALAGRDLDGAAAARRSGERR